MGGAPGAEAAPQFEVLALGGFQGPPQGLDLVAVPPLELGELGGEGAHDAAGRVVGRLRDRLWRVASLLGPQLLDSSTEFGGPVDRWRKSSETPAVWARPRKVMGWPWRIISRRPCSARAWAAALLRAAAWRRL